MNICEGTAVGVAEPHRREALCRVALNSTGTLSRQSSRIALSI